jgi:hypothetical protein
VRLWWGGLGAGAVGGVVTGKKKKLYLKNVIFRQRLMNFFFVSGPM